MSERTAGPVKARGVAETTWIVGLNVVALAALVAVVIAARTVVSWLFVAILLAIALDVAVQWLQARKLRRGLALAIVLAALALVVATVVVSVVPPLVKQAKALGEEAPALLARARESSAVAWFEEHVGRLETIGEGVASRAGTAAGPILSLLAGLAAGVTGALTILVLTIFLLIFGGDVVRGVLEWFPPERRREIRDVAGRMQKSVGGYAIGAIVIAAIDGAFTATTLAIAGTPFFLPLGLFAGFLALVPMVGNLIAGAMAVLVTLVTTGLNTAVVVAIALVIYGQVENHLLQPMVQRRSIRMNALVIVVALLVGTALAGVLGALLALPIAGAVQVVLREALDRRQRSWAR